jgi:hypothetical protein
VRRAWVSMARRRGAFEHLRLARGTLCMGSIFVVELERSTPPLPVLLGATILDVFNRIGTLNTRLYCSQLSVVCCVSFVQDKTMVNGMHRTAPFSAAKVRRAEAHAPLSVAAIFTPYSTAGRTCFLIVRGLLCCVFTGQDDGERDAPHCARSVLRVLPLGPCDWRARPQDKRLLAGRFFHGSAPSSRRPRAEGAWCPREFEHHCFFPLDRLFMNKSVAALDVICKPCKIWDVQYIYGMSNGCPIGCPTDSPLDIRI